MNAAVRAYLVWMMVRVYRIVRMMVWIVASVRPEIRRQQQRKSNSTISFVCRECVRVARTFVSATDSVVADRGYEAG
jgi:hypothetical protein